MPKAKTATVRYEEDLHLSLQSQTAAVEYLKAALEDSDPKIFLLALRDVAKARGGVGALARESNLNRENLYRMMSRSGNPSLTSLASALRAIGLRLSIESSTPPKQRRKAS
jgi:probable addiction module antidote protein